MILIVTSESGDFSHTKLIDWLEFYKSDYKIISGEAPLPAIVFWNERHFVVVYKIKKSFFESLRSRFLRTRKSQLLIQVADPAHGLLTYSKQEFIDNWIGKHANETTEEGIVLLLEPTPKLSEKEDDDIAKKEGIGFLWKYLSNYKRFMFQLGLGLLSESIHQVNYRQFSAIFIKIRMVSKLAISSPFSIFR